MLRFEQMRGPEDIEDAVREIYGRGLSEQRGCIHVTAVWQQSPQELITLKILPEAPRSPHDWFILQLARARADAIVTTGGILRGEPELTHDLPSSGPPWQALRQWRRQVLGMKRPTYSAILTSGRGLDFGHPLFHSRSVPVVYTGPQAARSLAVQAGKRVRIVGLERPGIRAVIRHLRDELGAETVSVEAGPSTSGRLYEDPLGVDELMLSVYCGSGLDESVQGGRFLSWERLEELFGARSKAYEVREESGLWRFYRLGG